MICLHVSTFWKKFFFFEKVRDHLPWNRKFPHDAYVLFIRIECINSIDLETNFRRLFSILNKHD